jgi:hypothetical protein
MERYAVQLVGSGQIVGSWLLGMDTALLLSTRFAEPAVVVRFSEWAPGRRLSVLAGERWEGAFPLVTFAPDWSLVFTGEIVPANEAGYTVTDCGRAAYRRGG